MQTIGRANGSTSMEVKIQNSAPPPTPFVQQRSGDCDSHDGEVVDEPPHVYFPHDGDLASDGGIHQLKVASHLLRLEHNPTRKEKLRRTG